MGQLPPFLPGPGPNPPRRSRLPWPGDLQARRPEPPPDSLRRGVPGGGIGRKVPARSRLLSGAFLAGAALVLLIRLPARIVPPPPSAGGLQSARIRSLSPTRPESVEKKLSLEAGRRLWQARAWPSLWKEEGLLEAARRLRELARARGLAAEAARMELLLEIYGPRPRR